MSRIISAEGSASSWPPSRRTLSARSGCCSSMTASSSAICSRRCSTASGYDVTLAASAEEALALKEKGAAFDLIVSDLDMPGMDGIALAERIKADPRLGEDPADRAFLPFEPAARGEEPGGGVRELCRQVRPADADEHASGLLQAMGSGGMSAEAGRARAGDRRLRHRGDGGPAVRLEARAGAGRVRAARPVAGAARAAGSGRSAQSARPHRHRHRSSPAPWSSAARRWRQRRSPSASRNAASFTASSSTRWAMC